MRGQLSQLGAAARNGDAGATGSQLLHFAGAGRSSAHRPVMSTVKRTAVPVPKWGVAWPFNSTDAVEVGKGESIGEMRHSGKTARKYDVFLNGERIGSVSSSERRGEAPSGMGSRIVRVTGWPTCWTGRDLDGRSGGIDSYYDQRNQAVYSLAKRVLDQRAKAAAA